MKIRECPCHKESNDCSKRHSICHETCPDYKVWREELNADNKAKKDSKKDEYEEYIIDKLIERKKSKK